MVEPTSWDVEIMMTDAGPSRDLQQNREGEGLERKKTYTWPYDVGNVDHLDWNDMTKYHAFVV
jgi:hypothetical protein